MRATIWTAGSAHPSPLLCPRPRVSSVHSWRSFSKRNRKAVIRSEQRVGREGDVGHGQEVGQADEPPGREGADGAGRGDQALPEAEADVVEMHRTRIRIVEAVLDANETIARANRDDFERAGVTVVNLMSAPGAGKTTLLERVLHDLDGVRAGVLEGDVQGSLDAERLASLHLPVTQIETNAGFGGECHLDANMVRTALPQVPLDELDLLVIENVGNLVCPAEFRVGEHHRVMVCSVAEGEDKPLKYPLMFRACELVLVNKIDLLPHLDFDVDKLLYNLDAVNPGVERMLVSARTGEGVDEWRDWLATLAARVETPA